MIRFARLSPSTASKQRAKQVGASVISVSDDFVHWQWSANPVPEDIRQPELPEHPAISTFQSSGAHLELEPRNVAVYQTLLELLQENLEAKPVITAGLATNVSVLLTADDAHTRRYDVIVPSGGVASEGRDETMDALRQVATALDEEIVRWVEPERNRGRGRAG